MNSKCSRLHFFWRHLSVFGPSIILEIENYGSDIREEFDERRKTTDLCDECLLEETVAAIGDVHLNISRDKHRDLI